MLVSATTMKCYSCNETIKTLHQDTEGNPICRKCYSYYSKCNVCGEVWYRDRLIRGTCEDCLEIEEEERC